LVFRAQYIRDWCAVLGVFQFVCFVGFDDARLHTKLWPLMAGIECKIAHVLALLSISGMESIKVCFPIFKEWTSEPLTSSSFTVPGFFRYQCLNCSLKELTAQVWSRMYLSPDHVLAQGVSMDGTLFTPATFNSGLRLLQIAKTLSGYPDSTPKASDYHHCL
jgi:hypothetical protein